MNLKIRSNVFETNSSSTHSICVTKNNILDKKLNNIEFTIGEFGWECRIIYDVDTKAKYLYTAILVEDKLDLIDKIKIILDNNNIEYNFETPEYETWEYEGREYTNLKYGYIDHSEDLDEFLNICEDENKLMRYLFSSESFIITGNDNDDHSVDINVKYDHEEYYKGN